MDTQEDIPILFKVDTIKNFILSLVKILFTITIAMSKNIYTEMPL